MSFPMNRVDTLLIELFIPLLDYDIGKILEIIFKNSELSSQPINRDFVKSLISKENNDYCENSIEEFVGYFNYFVANDQLEPCLMIAVLEGNLDDAESLLKKGAKLEGPAWNKFLLFDCFIQTKNVVNRKEILELLLEYDLDVSIRNDRGENILHRFIISCVEKVDPTAIKIAEILLNSGVPVEGIDNEGNSPLIHALKKHNFELILLLIEKGASVNKSCSFFDLFPIHKATLFKSSEEIFDLLLSNGAEIDSKNILGWTALHCACFCHNKEAISILIKKVLILVQRASAAQYLLIF